MSLYVGTPSPDNDGVDHINVYSKGRTQLGKLLSNFAYLPFEHPKYGVFYTIEGLWHWLSTGRQYEFFRTMSGYQAKTAASGLEKIHCSTFESDICMGILQKVAVSPELRELLIHSTLPFVHYYNYGGKVIVVDSHNWQLECIDQLRSQLHTNPTAIPMVDIGTKSR